MYDRFFMMCETKGNEQGHDVLSGTVQRERSRLQASSVNPKALPLCSCAVEIRLNRLSVSHAGCSRYRTHEDPHHAG